MKAAVLSQKGRFEMRELPIPVIGDNQILVRNKFCAVCNSTDTKLFKGTHALAKYPSVIGHEGAGVVEMVGKNITKVKAGDKVLGGNYPDSPELASLWGQYAEYGIVDEEEIVLIPENVSLEQATCSHMLGETLNAVRVSEVRPGDHVAIIGAGAVGMNILTNIKHFFPGSVIVLDLLDEKLDSALKLGANAVFKSNDPDLAAKILEFTKGHGIDKVYEAVGNQATYNLAMDIINKFGTILAFGIIEGVLEVAFRKAYSKELQIRWCNYTGAGGNRNKELVLDMMSRGLIDVNPLITSRVPLDDIEEGLKLIAAGKEIRVIVQI